MKKNTKTRDPVNQPLITLEQRIGLQTIGVMNNAVWYEDPKRLVFTLARYKFVAKMLTGKSRVAEIGRSARRSPGAARRHRLGGYSTTV